MPLNFYVVQLADSCIQNFHLERLFVVYRPGSFAIRRHLIFDHISENPNENFEYGCYLKHCTDKIFNKYNHETSRLAKR